MLAGALGELEEAGPVEPEADVDGDTTIVTEDVDVDTATLVLAGGDAVDKMIVLTTGETPVAGELVVGLAEDTGGTRFTVVLFRK